MAHPSVGLRKIRGAIRGWRDRTGGGTMPRPMSRVLVIAVAALSAALASTALAIVPRIVVCGRVTESVASPPRGEPYVRLGTQEPRQLVMGGTPLPQVGQEVCLSGTDVIDVNPPTPEPAPLGIVGYRVTPFSEMPCAEVSRNGATLVATFMPPSEQVYLNPGTGWNAARLTLPLATDPDSACVRLAADSKGDPIAVVSTAPTPTASPATPSPRTAMPSALPNTDAADDRVGTATALGAAVALATLALAGLWLVRRSSRAPRP